MNKKPVEQLLIEIDHYSQVRNLCRKEMAQELNIPYATFKKWFLKGKSRNNPSLTYIIKMEKFLELQEAYRRAEKIKFLLLLMEDELAWFRDSPERARDIFREALDLGDVGYISSLLMMLGDEDKFIRWVSLTTNRFNFFKGKER